MLSLCPEARFSSIPACCGRRRTKPRLAGVLAHEISHVALRHATSQASKANILQLPAAIAGAVIGQGSAGAQLGRLGLGLGLNLLTLRYSRGAETEADALATRIMAQAGYNPLEMARFFEKLEAQGGGRAPEFLSSHPSPGNRIENVQAGIRTLPQQSYPASAGGFEAAQAQVAQLPAPRRAQSADRAGGPSVESPGDFEQLDAGRFRLAYPSSWEAFGRDSSMVTLAPREGLVRDSFGNVHVGYGALVSYYFPTRRSNLRTATEELISRLQSGNPTLQLTGAPRSARVSGAPALLTTLSGSSPYGGAERNVLVTVARPEGLFFLVFVAPQREFDRLQGAFEQMLGSIRFRA